jgi:hypothetical protein
VDLLEEHTLTEEQDTLIFRPFEIKTVRIV